MLIIIDKRIPREAKQKLAFFGELAEFETSGITYEAISGHPDIFMCELEGQLVVAPNIPESFPEQLRKHGAGVIMGESPVGAKYPESVHYNAVVTEKYMIHNFRHTDSSLTNRTDNLDLIHVDQGYCRCNLLPLKNDHFITSDAGIQKVLTRFHIDVLYVDPRDILLPGKKHGFFGGACGVFNDHVFTLGSLDHFNDGGKVSEYLSGLGYQIIELYDGPLFDGGSIFFLES